MKLVLQFLKNSFIAIVRGELLLRLKLGEYFVHIMFCFMMMGLTILFSMLIDNSLHKVEENREKIDDLEMVGSQYRFEIAYLESRPSVSDQLARMGSSVREPAAPATIIKLENPAPAAGRRATARRSASRKAAGDRAGGTQATARRSASRKAAINRAGNANAAAGTNRAGNANTAAGTDNAGNTNTAAGTDRAGNANTAAGTDKAGNINR